MKREKRYEEKFYRETMEIGERLSDLESLES